MKNWRVLFCVYAVGNVAYSTIEVLWRGYTHWTMGVAGGVCFQMLYAIEHRWSQGRQWVKCAAGALGITAVELGFGLVLNRKLGLGIWDYSTWKGNVLGQICPLFTAIWFLLSWPALKLSRLVGNFLTNLSEDGIIQTTLTR